jgi:hypothetical protein
MIKVANFCKNQFAIEVDTTPKEIPYFYVVDNKNKTVVCAIQVNGPAYFEIGVTTNFLTIDQKKRLMVCLERNRYKEDNYNNWQYMCDLMRVLGYKNIDDYRRMTPPYYEYL